MPSCRLSAGLRRAVRTPGLVVRDARAALGHRSDPVDLASDPRALELEREPALGRRRGRLRVPWRTSSRIRTAFAFARSASEIAYEGNRVFSHRSSRARSNASRVRSTVPRSQPSMIACTSCPPTPGSPPPGSRPSSLDSTNCSSQFSSVDRREYESVSASSAAADRSVQSRWNHHRARVVAERQERVEARRGVRMPVRGDRRACAATPTPPRTSTRARRTASPGRRATGAPAPRRIAR